MTANTERAELLPCPFCGGDAAFDQHDDGCYFRMHAAQRRALNHADLSSAFDVLAAWNRRAPSAAPVELPEPDFHVRPSISAFELPWGVCMQENSGSKGAYLADTVRALLATQRGEA